MHLPTHKKTDSHEKNCSCGAHSLNWKNAQTLPILVKMLLKYLLIRCKSWYVLMAKYVLSQVDDTQLKTFKTY